MLFIRVGVGVGGFPFMVLKTICIIHQKTYKAFCVFVLAAKHHCDRLWPVTDVSVDIVAEIRFPGSCRLALVRTLLAVTL